MSIWPRVLILGSGGQLGHELVQSFGGHAEVIACDRNSLDLTSPDKIREKVRTAAPDLILNAAAYTAVDRAESEPDLATAINTHAPAILAEEALRAGALLVHYSTDYVFDGTKNSPWTEIDATNPLNTYGASKLAGEKAITQVGGRYLIFRTSWVYGPYGKNFLFTMLRLGRERDELKVVDDQVGSPTTSIELAKATNKITTRILRGDFGSPSVWAGLYNMTCGGSVSWCGFAQAIFARSAKLLKEKSSTVHPIKTTEFPTPAARPHNSVLSNEKLFQRFGVRLAAWEPALDEVLQIVTQRK